MRDIFSIWLADIKLFLLNQLSQDNRNLGEIIVIGYFKQKRIKFPSIFQTTIPLPPDFKNLYTPISQKLLIFRIWFLYEFKLVLNHLSNDI